MATIFDVLRESFATARFEKAAQEKLKVKMEQEQDPIPIDEIQYGVALPQHFENAKDKKILPGSFDIPAFKWATNYPGGIDGQVIFDHPEFGLKSYGYALSGAMKAIPNREMLLSNENRNTLVTVLDTPNSRIILIYRPANGYYHPAQDAIGVTFGTVTKPDGEATEITGLIIADGLSTIRKTKSELSTDDIITAESDSMFKVIANGSAQHAARVARASSRVALGVKPQEVGVLLHNTAPADQEGASTAQILQLTHTPDGSFVVDGLSMGRVASGGEAGDVSAQGVIIRNEAGSIQTIPFIHDNPVIRFDHSETITAEELEPLSNVSRARKLRHQKNADTKVVANDLIMTSDGAQLTRRYVNDPSRIFDYLRSLTPKEVVEAVTEGYKDPAKPGFLRVILADVEGKPDSDDGSIAIVLGRKDETLQEVSSEEGKQKAQERDETIHLPTKEELTQTLKSAQNEIQLSKDLTIQRISKEEAEMHQLEVDIASRSRDLKLPKTDRDAIRANLQRVEQIEESLGKLKALEDATARLESIVQPAVYSKMFEMTSVIDTITSLARFQEQEQISQLELNEVLSIFLQSLHPITEINKPLERPEKLRQVLRYLIDKQIVAINAKRASDFSETFEAWILEPSTNNAAKLKKKFKYMNIDGLTLLAQKVSGTDIIFDEENPSVRAIVEYLEQVKTSMTNVQEIRSEISG